VLNRLRLSLRLQPAGQRGLAATRASIGALTLACALCAAPAWAQNKPLQLSELAPDAAVVKQVYITDKLKPVLKGVTKVAITGFAMETVLKTGKGISSGGATQEVTYILAEVPQAATQAAWDQACDDFVADLKAMGLEVLTVADVMATAAYRKAATAGAAGAGPRKVEQGGAITALYNARGLGTVSESRWMYLNNLSGGGGVFGALRAVGGIGGMLVDGKLQEEIAKELGVTCIGVHLPMEFVEQSTSASSDGAGVNVGVASRLRLSFSMMGYIGAGGALQNDWLSLPIRTSLVLSGTPVREVKDISSTAANVGLGLLSMVAGGRTSTRLTEKTALAHPEQFVAAFSEGMAKYRPIMKQALMAMQQ
jgi:hypothetical protein